MLQREIQRIIANSLQFDLHDPRVTSRITITRVQLTRDLSLSRIYYSVLGTEADRRTAERLLEHASGHLRRTLGDELSTRSVPELRFIYDESIAGSIEIGETLRKLQEEREAWEAAHPDEFPPEYEENPTDPDNVAAINDLAVALLHSDGDAQPGPKRDAQPDQPGDDAPPA